MLRRNDPPERIQIVDGCSQSNRRCQNFARVTGIRGRPLVPRRRPPRLFSKSIVLRKATGIQQDRIPPANHATTVQRNTNDAPILDNEILHGLPSKEGNALAQGDLEQSPLEREIA